MMMLTRLCLLVAQEGLSYKGEGPSEDQLTNVYVWVDCYGQKLDLLGTPRRAVRFPQTLDEQTNITTKNAFPVKNTQRLNCSALWEFVLKVK